MHRDTQTEIITQVDDGGEFVDSGISWYKLICKRIARTDGRRHTDRQTDKINRQLTLLNDHTSSLLRILTLSLHRNKVCHFISSTRQGLSFYPLPRYRVIVIRFHRLVCTLSVPLFYDRKCLMDMSGQLKKQDMRFTAQASMERKESQLVSWYFEPSRPQRITSGLQKEKRE